MKRYRALWGAALLSIVAALGCSDESNPSSPPRFSARSDSSFVVGAGGVLQINDFAGNINVTTGAANAVDIVAVKWARKESNLDQLDLEMLTDADTVRVTTANPLGLSNAWVDVDATIPPDMLPWIQAGAADITYVGPAAGQCSFMAGAGNIWINLPPSANVALELSVGAGTIQVGFPVVGQVEDRVVDGVIGTGADGKITATLGAGNIIIASQ